jgi:hypothetical protein
MNFVLGAIVGAAVGLLVCLAAYAFMTDPRPVVGSYDDAGNLILTARHPVTVYAVRTNGDTDCTFEAVDSTPNGNALYLTEAQMNQSFAKISAPTLDRGDRIVLVAPPACAQPYMAVAKTDLGMLFGVRLTR